MKREKHGIMCYVYAVISIVLDVYLWLHSIWLVKPISD